MLLEGLVRVGLKLMPSKGKFVQEEVLFLRHKIDPRSISSEGSKVAKNGHQDDCQVTKLADLVTKNDANGSTAKTSLSFH
ncbi:hypothetical protein TNCV_4398321 [Trichonephila clavipes]|nr:hypothetical protein TNCV_4398321 [Trichonephila clavipes]